MAAKTATGKAPLREVFCPHTYTYESGHTIVLHAGSKWRADSPEATANPQFFTDRQAAANERPSWSKFIGAGVSTAAASPRRSACG